MQAAQVALRLGRHHAKRSAGEPAKQHRVPIVSVRLRGVQFGPDDRALGKDRLDLRYDKVTGVVLDREQAEQARRVVLNVIGQGAD